MTKIYVEPKNTRRALMNDAVSEQMGNAVVAWQEANFMFEDTYTVHTAFTMSVPTASAYDKEGRVQLLRFWDEILNFRIGLYLEADLIVRHCYSKTISAELQFGLVKDVPVIVVSYGYFDISEAVNWVVDPEHQSLLESVIANATHFLPDDV